MDKQKVVYAYNGTLFNLKKERTFDGCHNVNFKDMKLRDNSQMQKDKYCRIPRVWGTWSH